MTAPLRNQLVLAPENIRKIQRTGNHVISNTAYTKDQDIHDQESFRKSGFLYSALQSPIQHCVVTAVTFVVRLSPKENTGSRLFTEVKPCWTGLISGWVIKSTASDIEISSLLNQNPLKHSKKSKIFFAICLNLLIYYGH